MTKQIELALTAWKWLATDLNNTEPQPPLIIDDPDSRKSDALCVGDALIPFDARRFAPSVLHKKVFGKMLKAEVDEILNLLESVGVVGVSCREETTGGRPRELRHITTEWLCADNPSAFARLETKLTEMLTKGADAKRDEDHEQATKATAEIVLAVYDWLSDPENTEIDNQNAQVISINKLCREFEGVAEGLEILERHRIISGQYKEPNARGRIIARLNQDWFKIGGRSRLVNLLIPPKPEPYKPVGPLRALMTFFFLHQGRSQTIAGGMIISDEQLCRLLLAGDYPVVTLDDSDTRICASTICRHRFKLSESTATLDHPALLVLQDFFFKFNNILIDYKRGDVISRRDFFEFLTKGNAEWPVIPAAESEYTICPRCNRASKTTALQAENR